MLGRMPVRNEDIAQQQRAARAIQLQQSIAALPAGQPLPGPQQAAAVGGQMAAEAGKQQVAQATAGLQTAQQAGRLALGEQQLTGAASIQAQQERARQETLGQTAKLAAIDSAAKQELVDQELQIRKDSQDRALFSTRQLADYAALSTNADEALANWSQKAQLYSKRNLQLLEASYNKVEQALKTGYLDKKTKLDRQSQMELMQIKRDMEQRIAKAKAKAGNIRMMTGAVSGLMQAGAAVAYATGAGAPLAVGLQAGAVGVQTMGEREAAKQERI